MSFTYFYLLVLILLKYICSFFLPSYYKSPKTRKVKFTTRIRKNKAQNQKTKQTGPQAKQKSKPKWKNVIHTLATPPPRVETDHQRDACLNMQIHHLHRLENAAETAAQNSAGNTSHRFHFQLKLVAENQDK